MTNSRELDVLVLERLDHAVDLPEHEVDPAEDALLEVLELLLVLQAVRAGHVPHRPISRTSR